ncbi:MAG: HAMP domain-containing sensor histidine kinase [Clostridiales bacterium]
MFNKLKLKFLIINMSLLTFVFVTIFTVIYISTTVIGQKQIDITLKKALHSPELEYSPSNDEHIESQNNINKHANSNINSSYFLNYAFSKLTSSKTQMIPGSAGIILASTDYENDTIYYSTVLDIDNSIIEEKIFDTIKKTELSGNIKIDENNFAFLKKFENNELHIAFVDITFQKNISLNLLKTLLSVGSLSLIILFLISLYFANKAIKPIETVFEKQKQFVADASHELKTPLTIIKTNIALLLSNGNEKISNQVKWIKYIDSQTDRMTKLINDMLSLAKIDNSNKNYYHVKFDFSNLLKNTLLEFEAPFFENKIHLRTNIKNNISLSGNKDNIKKLLNILLENAIKHTPKENKIDISLRKNKNKIELIIKNYGTIISNDCTSKIFERFYRPDNSRNRETGGYGLGLSIAKSIVEEHKGKIYAKSGNNFTVFIVEVPQK